MTEPVLTLYKAKGDPIGKAVIVLPGGGYETEAIQHEGHDVAKAFAERGITAGVLKYRLPNPASSTAPHLTPLSDVRRAVEVVSASLLADGHKSPQVGVFGFSAGSHLATAASLQISEAAGQNPDFSGLIYGVTRLNQENRKWLEQTLFHPAMTPEEVAQNTFLERVSLSTPPAFLVHAFDDTVCNYLESTLYAEALIKSDVDAEIHLYTKGGHGFGLGRAADGTDQWIDLAVNWIVRLPKE